MQKERIISLISNPETINKEDNLFLENIIKKFPFFSISHILLAKGLLNTESVRYNRKLKQAALYSLERKHLFKLITQNLEKKSLSVEEEAEMEIIHVEDTPEFNDVETDLKIGKPLKFEETEEYSFAQWLSLTKVKKIDRSEKKTKEYDLINSFIESNPNIKPEKNKFFSPTETAKTSLVENNELVTETLARVYLEQQHFEKAIEAYKKLSLKYPKKSSFFADQINLINDLKNK
ncbi:MAG: hypothetical protein CMD22_02385 [Flavobacteriales bacterium]|nr:hypothetical protein [Flavobacteriales bacterium]|tara:strand:+ start:3553 stop:4254 length:702 start_codon:yes stop_codon:yes gene_type:complete